MLITATGDSIHSQGGKYLLSCSSKIYVKTFYMLNAGGSLSNNFFRVTPQTASLSARHRFDLTPRRTPPLKNLTFPQLLNKFHTICVTRRFIIVSHVNPVHLLPLSFFKTPINNVDTNIPVMINGKVRLRTGH